MDWMKRAGNVLGVAGSVYSGSAKAEALNLEAALRRRRAREILAAGTRRAHDIRQDGKRLESDAVAQQAAAGGGMDVAMVERLARIQGEVDYNVLATMYDAQSGAAAERFKAKQAGKAATVSRVTGYLGAAPSILDMADDAYRIDESEGMLASRRKARHGGL